jgi:hypothetical protein
MAKWVAETHPEFQFVREQSTLPSFDPDPAHYHDGGYFAVFARK